MELWKNVDFVSLGDRPDLSAQSFGLVPLMRDLLAKKAGHLCELELEGAFREDESEDDDHDSGQKFVDLLTKQGGRLIYKLLNSYGHNYIYLWNDGIVQINISGTYLSLHGYSHNEKFLQEISDYVNTQWAPPERTGHIYAIMRQGMHLALSSLGNAGIALESGNYTEEVLADFRYAIKDLKSDNPSGRIVIMRGAPGTGKTHLIRAMLLEVPDAMFVLVSPEMVTTLAGPELLPLLISHRSGNVPIVLILEDADKCLVTRASENINSIQSLLNLGDGILGSLLDLRIVATTNADELKMEAAILRPGRLSRMLEVGFLDPKTAQGVFHRLIPGAKLPEKLLDIKGREFKVTLAEVYSLARQSGWEPPSRKVQEDEDPDYID